MEKMEQRQRLESVMGGTEQIEGTDLKSAEIIGVISTSDVLHRGNVNNFLG